MRYKIVEEVKLDAKKSLLVKASAQCMLDLLCTRLVNTDFPDLKEYDSSSIDYDFSLYDKEALDAKEGEGYSNDKYIESADSFMRRL